MQRKRSEDVIEDYVLKDSTLASVFVSEQDREMDLIYKKRKDRVFMSKSRKYFLKVQPTPKNMGDVIERMIDLEEEGDASQSIVHIQYYTEYLVNGEKFSATLSEFAGFNDISYSKHSKYIQKSACEVILLCHDLLGVTNYIHRKLGVVHRDIHPTNVVFNEESCFWTLIDVDLACFISHKTKKIPEHGGFPFQTLPGEYKDIASFLRKQGLWSGDDNDNTVLVWSDRFQCVTTILHLLNMPQDESFYHQVDDKTLKYMFSCNILGFNNNKIVERMCLLMVYFVHHCLNFDYDKAEQQLDTLQHIFNTFEHHIQYYDEDGKPSWYRSGNTGIEEFREYVAKKLVEYKEDYAHTFVRNTNKKQKLKFIQKQIKTKAKININR